MKQSTGAKANFKDQALLNQAKNAFENKRTDEAIDCVSKAIEINETNIELYLFRSKCYSSVAKTHEAIQDAEKAIELEEEQMRLNPSIELCGGYYARAEAKFLSGDFEEALVDYNRCAARRHDVLYQQGIDKAEFNIRKAFEFTHSEVRLAEQALMKGVLLEGETREMTFEPESTLTRFKAYTYTDTAEYDSEDASASLTTQRVGRGADEQNHQPNALVALSKREMLLPTAEIHYALTKEARRNPMYQKLAKLTEDKVFLEFIKDMPNLASTCQKAISFINEREKYWKDQNHTSLDVNEIKPQPEKHTKPVKNIKDFVRYSELRRQERLQAAENEDKTQMMQKILEGRKVFYQKSALELKQQTQEENTELKEAEFKIIMLNVEECIANGCDRLALEFINEYIEGTTVENENEDHAVDQFYPEAVEAKALLLVHQGDCKEAYGLIQATETSAVEGSADKILFQRLKAIILSKMGEHNEAILLLEQILNDKTSDDLLKEDIEVLLANIYYKEYCYEEALDCCRAAYKGLKRRADEDDCSVYKLNGEVVLYNKLTVQEVYINTLEIEADCLKQLKMDLEYVEKYREIERLKKRL